MQTPVSSFPTDSFYKFSFIASLVLCVFGIYIREDAYKMHHSATHNAHLALSRQHAEMENWLKQDSILLADKSQDSALIAKIRVKGVKSEKIFNWEIEAASQIKEKYHNEIAANALEKRKLDSYMVENKVSAEIINTMDHIMEAEKSRSTLCLVIGTFLAVFGAIMWMWKVQSPSDRKLLMENEKLALEIKKMKRDLLK